MALRNPHLNDSGQGVEAASRASRFLARLLDAMVWLAPLPLVIFSCLGGVAVLGLWVALFIAQLWLLVTRGQTIGKQLMHIYIMRSDGDIPNVGWLLLREFAIPAFAGIFRYVGRNDPSPFGQAFQVLVCLLWLIDSLFIFGPTRRCLHDWVAGTHVVRAD